jgi:putative transposase
VQRLVWPGIISRSEGAPETRSHSIFNAGIIGCVSQIFHIWLTSLRAFGSLFWKAMPSSHTSLHFHLIFSTKERMPLIANEWRNRLHAYLGGIVKGLEGVPLAVGGIEDHVHLLVGLKSSHRLDYFLRDLKADASEWVHREIGKRVFGWQKGYGAFSVSPSNIEGVKGYVLNQVKHHRRKTFQEEYIELLRASGLAYDERYLW